MLEATRRVLATVVTVVAGAIVVFGLVAGDGRPTDRAQAVAEGLRCPTCQGSSIADAPSETAQALRVLIADQVAAGWTDDEIEAHFVARYGEWVLLDPPATGRNLLLWGLPALALATGVAAIAWLRAGSKRRLASPPPVADPEEPAPSSMPAVEGAP